MTDDRPFKIYRYGDVGRALYDTQCTQVDAEASAKTAGREYPNQKIEIVNTQPEPQLGEGFNIIAEAQAQWIKSVPWGVSTEEKAAFVSGFLAGDASRKERG